MTKIYVKVTQQEIDYYLLWDTFFELPYSIPMDLATLV